jgi:hypothetical protein
MRGSLRELQCRVFDVAYVNKTANRVMRILLPLEDLFPYSPRVSADY